MQQAESCGTGAYIEVVTDQMAASPLAMKLHDAMQILYGKQ
jgi:indolepyruvate decarboxylase